MTARPDALQEALGYSFSDQELLDRSVTHRSWAHDQTPPTADNERLEFLGDAVLGLVVAEQLVTRFPDAEGRLTRARAALVSRVNLARVARRLELGAFLKLGRGEEASGGRDKDSILCDAFEAVLGAVYQDGGLDAARAFLRHSMGEEFVPEADDGGLHSPRDPCTELQETLQQAGALAPRYKVLSGEGPAHAPTWHLEVRSGDRVLGQGSGRSKQDARRLAAREAIAVLAAEPS